MVVTGGGWMVGDVEEGRGVWVVVTGGGWMVGDVVLAGV